MNKSIFIFLCIFLFATADALAVEFSGCMFNIESTETENLWIDSVLD